MTGHKPWSEIRHKSPSGAAPIEFSCSPYARLPLDGHADAMSRILDALEADPRTIGPVVGYDDELERVSSTFQVEAGSFAEAVETSAAAFDDALRAADVGEYTIAVSVAAGGPELLP
jgi:hypothetical protein